MSGFSGGGAPTDSPTFTGTPAAPTAAAGTNTTQLATTAFVQAAKAINAPVATYATNSTFTTTVPLDDTKPQNTEGTQILSGSITPTSSTSKILAMATVPVCASLTASDNLIGAMFVAGDANAVDVGLKFANNVFEPLPLLFYVWSPGTVSAQTVTVRMGLSSAGTWTINGGNGARYFGGASAAKLFLMELPQ